MRTGVLMAMAAAILAGSCVDNRGAAKDPAQSYIFTLDGEPFTPVVYSLQGTPDTPREGDVIAYRDLFMTLGTERCCVLKTVPEFSGWSWERVVLVTEPGREETVAVRIATRREKDTPVIVNPLAAMTDAQAADVRGVIVQAWSPEIAAHLRRVNPRHTCLTIKNLDKTTFEGALAQLPADLSYLCLGDHGSLGPLRDLGQLLLLDLGGDKVDARDVARCTALRYLCLPHDSTCDHVEDLGALRELRTLDMCRSEINDLSFVTHLSELRRLRIEATGITDLTPLARLSKLQWLSADESPIARIPTDPLPSLEYASLLSTQVNPAGTEAFCKANPACKVYRHWIEPLRETLAPCTRVCVQNGWTPEGDTSFECRDAEAVRAILEFTEIDEGRSHGECSCSGLPQFEFYQGDTLRARIGLKHAAALYWPATWPADAKLTARSAERYCKWLAARGVRYPELERTRPERTLAAARQRLAAYRSLLPPQVSPETPPEEFAAALRAAVADEIDRAVLCFKLFGCDDAPWSLCTAVDETIKDCLLPQVSADARLAAARRVLDEPKGANGAARWLLGEGGWADHAIEQLDDMVPKLAERALSHPRQIARRRTLIALGKMGTQTALGLLRRVLAGAVAGRATMDDYEEVLPGKTTYGPGDLKFDKSASDQACAASLLAECGDAPSAARIRTLAAGAEDADKELYEKALQLLGAAK